MHGAAVLGLAQVGAEVGGEVLFGPVPVGRLYVDLGPGVGGRCGGMVGEGVQSGGPVQVECVGQSVGAKAREGGGFGQGHAAEGGQDGLLGLLRGG